MLKIPLHLFGITVFMYAHLSQKQTHKRPSLARTTSTKFIEKLFLPNFSFYLLPTETRYSPLSN